MVFNSHLNEAQRERLAALESSESSDDDEAKDVATRGRGGKTKPVRHQLRRTPTETQQARWEAVQQAREQGLSIRAIARKLGMDRNTAGKYALGGDSAYKETQCQGACQSRDPGRITNLRRLNWVTYSLFHLRGQNRWTTTYGFLPGVLQLGFPATPSATGNGDLQPCQPEGPGWTDAPDSPIMALGRMALLAKVDEAGHPARMSDPPGLLL